jgi:hypothetical protein
MTKAGGRADDDSNDVLWDGVTFAIRAMHDGNQLPARRWLDTLGSDDRQRFEAASMILDNSRRSGRPTSHRIQPLDTSRLGLRIFRVTRRGAVPPHLRLLHIQEHNTMWAALGTTCAADIPSADDVARAEDIARRWLGQ